MAAMADLLRDLRSSVRTLIKTPGFTAIAVITLAVGIGANTAVFSLVHGVLLNPLPYPHSEHLVAVYGRAAGYEKSPISYLNFLDWQRDSRSFSSMAIYRSQDYNLIGSEQGERLSGYMVSANFFSTLGINPTAGRFFNAADDHIGAAPVAIVSGSLWQRKFASSRSAIGRTLTLNGSSYTIVGVAPADFTFYGNSRDVYTPIGQWADPSFLDRRISVSARAFGRLKAGVTVSQAQAEMNNIAHELAQAFPEADKDLGINVISLKEDIVGNVQPLLLVLLGAVGFLLLIACANVASLLLARSTARRRELAVRAALGASRTRLLRLLMSESLLLSLGGGLIGIAAAAGITDFGVKFLPVSLPRIHEISIDTGVLMFGVGLALLAGVVFGVSPALRATRVNLLEVLNEAGRGGTGVRHRLHKVLIACEVAVAIILLAGAGLMLRTMAALWRVNPGFDPSHAITFSLSMPAGPNTTPAQTRARLRQFDAAMRAISSVKAVSVTLGSRPMIHDSSLPLWIEGEPKPAHDNDMHPAMFYLVESGFQRAMGVTLQQGRFISDDDDERAPTVIVIDDVFARNYLHGANPIGKHVHLEQFGVEAEIVGVVGHVKQWGPAGDPNSAIEAEFFYPFMQLPEKLMPMVANGVAVVLRTKGDPEAVMSTVRDAVGKLDSREVIFNVQTLDDVWASATAARRLTMLLLAALAVLALALACVGIYGVVSYMVGQRTQEIGVRMALGAEGPDILRLILGEGVGMAFAGAVAGIPVALGLTHIMANQLFGVSSHDPVTFVAVAVLLIVVALAASYIPARRAMRLDPMAALRDE